MITVITGLPGNGKTLYALTLVKALSEKEGRPVFYARIKGLKLPWTLIDPFEWFKCPPNAIIVIDEAQKSADPSDPKSPTLFGVRQRGAPVPIWAAKLEDHRHGGVDLFILTQDAMLLDSHDRKLCERHFHMRRTFGMQRATIHEFTGGARANASTTQKGSIRHEWAFNKEAYAWYESAEVHTHKARIPVRVWLFLALPLLLGALVWFFWTRIDPSRKQAALDEQAAGASQGGARSAASAGRPVTAADYAADFRPRVAGLAYTAPAYDEVTKPVEAPYPAACVEMAKRCECFSQQGTKLEVPAYLCQGIVKGGFFVSWKTAEARQGVYPLVQRQNAPAVSFPVVAGAASLGGSATSHFTAQTSSAAPVVTGVVEQAPRGQLPVAPAQ